MKLRILPAIALTIAASTLAACGGGGGGGPLPPSGGPTSTPTPASTPCPAGWSGTPPNCVQPATASGSVVDYDTQTPLSGVKVGLAPWTAGATPTPMGTTAPNGTFSFTTAPGTYELVIGSGSPTDTRTTLHQQVVLTSGQDALGVATPSPQVYVTPDPVQTTHNYRLKMLSSDVQSCMTYANQQLQTDRSVTLGDDEFMWETGRWYDEQAVYDPASTIPMGTGGANSMVNTLFGTSVVAAGYSSGLNGPSNEQLTITTITKESDGQISAPALMGVECDMNLHAAIVTVGSDPR